MSAPTTEFVVPTEAELMAITRELGSAAEPIELLERDVRAANEAEQRISAEQAWHLTMTARDIALEAEVLAKQAETLEKAAEALFLGNLAI